MDTSSKLKEKKLLIVCVPGIMGTRLMVNDHMVWDPDSFSTMTKFIRMEPVDRQTLLLHEYLLTIPGIDDGYGKIPRCYPHALERGWHAISWKYYGALLESLDSWSAPSRYFVDVQVYAFGYNWLQTSAVSGEELNVMLADLVAREKSNSEDVKVFLISHSMGGLVVRECINEMGDTSLISGLIWKIGKHLIISGCDAGLIPAQSEQEIRGIRGSLAEMEKYNYMCYNANINKRFSYIQPTIFQNNTSPYQQGDYSICLDEQKILYDLCAADKYKIHESKDDIFFSQDDIKKIKCVIQNICSDWNNGLYENV